MSLYSKYAKKDIIWYNVIEREVERTIVITIKIPKKRFQLLLQTV